MKNSIWNKRIPTLLGIFIIGIGIFVTTMLVQTGVITIQNAAVSQAPENVRITNISTKSFTVSYTTQAKVLGTLSYGVTSDYGSVGYDDRDQKNTTSADYNVHYITVKNLKPSTLYFFSITSEKDTYLHNDTPFQVTTGPILPTDPPKQQPALGKVVLPDGSIPPEAIVYLSGPGTQTISALLQNNGSYILPLNSLRTEDSTSYANLIPNQILQELAVSVDKKSNVSILASQINPIPVITLSQDYDFTVQSTPLASGSAQTSFPFFTTSISKSSTPQILTPNNDQGFTDTKPTFKGKAQPGEDIQITVHSDQAINTTIIADKYGNWSYRPDESLTPGEHTITIVTHNAAGILQTIKKSFTVYAAGSQVSQSATPSATLTPKPTNIPTPVPTVIFPTSTPAQLTPTPTTIVMIVTTAPQPTALPTKGGQQLQPGSDATTFLAIAAVITTSLGVLLFFFSQRRTI